jgi:Bacterial aa3 type cytochrome c oxidase subunit IV
MQFKHARLRARRCGLTVPDCSMPGAAEAIGRLLAKPACDTKAPAAVKHPGVKGMAIDTSGGHSAMDYPEHVRTYKGFLRATMILMALVVAILLFLLTLVP